MRYTKEHQRGGFTNPDPELRRKAMQMALDGCSVARELGARELVVWSAYDGMRRANINRPQCGRGTTRTERGYRPAAGVLHHAHRRLQPPAKEKKIQLPPGGPQKDKTTRPSGNRIPAAQKRIRPLGRSTAPGSQAEAFQAPVLIPSAPGSFHLHPSQPSPTRRPSRRV
jgi:hypothetical protein